MEFTPYLTFDPKEVDINVFWIVTLGTKNKTIWIFFAVLIP